MNEDTQDATGEMKRPKDSYRLNIGAVVWFTIAGFLALYLAAALGVLIRAFFAGRAAVIQPATFVTPVIFLVAIIAGSVWSAFRRMKKNVQ